MMHRSYLPHAKAKEGQRKVSPSGPSYMSNDQIANYLKDLRTNRPARPSGSRPLPAKSTGSVSGSRDDLPPRAASAMSSYSNSARSPTKSAADIDPPRATSSLSNHRPFSPRGSLYGSAGRSAVQEPRTVPVRQNVSPTRVHSRFSPPSPGMYRESNQRRFEREQARSLRDALEEMNVDEEDEDARIQRAAQDEATELVWMHQNPRMASKNPYAPYRNPDVDRFRGSPSKTNPPAQPSAPSSPRRNGLFRSSVSEAPSAGAGLSGSPTRDTQQEKSGSDEPTSPRKYGSLRKSLKVNFSLPREQQSPSKSRDGACGLGLSNIGGDSNRGIFRNPNDHIYEEPIGSPPKEEDERPDFSRSDSSALRSKPRNALPRGSRPLPGRLGSIPFVDKLSRFELHKHPPTQSRNAEYKTNDPTPKSIPDEASEGPSDAMKDGLEIRSDDIRAATSKRLKDRSSKLPMPTAVSDRTGRPIVSFEPAWRPTEAQSPPKPEPEPELAAPTPPVASAAPTIEVSEPPSIPVINVPDEREPTISEMGGGSAQTAPKEPRARPSPPKSGPSSSSSPRKPTRTLQDRWLSAYTRSGVPTAKCESCSLPISGRIVTAAGTRFHPECFVCFHCQTALECVAFYQEPEAKRYERLADASAYDEEARAPRFYCHLDFHELFSPRCKSCKTPIEGEVVVACGSEWHVGHFFCAECGDPFDQDTPFVEKDGFAWCLQCHSRRTAPRCLGCKKPVLDDVVVTAVGGQWHDECFNCHECGSELGTDGRYFVREGEPRRTAKGRIIGGPVQLAVCERCEGIRLKASP